MCGCFDQFWALHASLILISSLPTMPASVLTSAKPVIFGKSPIKDCTCLPVVADMMLEQADPALRYNHENEAHLPDDESLYYPKEQSDGET